MQRYELNIKPMSLHKYYRVKNNRQYITNEGRDFKQSVIDKIVDIDNIVCHQVPIKLYIEFGFNDYRVRDIDNAVKCLQDALNGLLYVDDSLVYELHCRKFLGQETNFINIEISTLEI